MKTAFPPARERYFDVFRGTFSETLHFGANTSFLEGFWEPFGTLWGPLGSLGDPLGTPWTPLGSPWGPSGTLLGSLWALLGAIWIPWDPSEMHFQHL